MDRSSLRRRFWINAGLGFTAGVAMFLHSNEGAVFLSSSMISGLVMSLNVFLLGGLLSQGILGMHVLAVPWLAMGIGGTVFMTSTTFETISRILAVVSIALLEMLALVAIYFYKQNYGFEHSYNLIGGEVERVYPKPARITGTIIAGIAIVGLIIVGIFPVVCYTCSTCNSTGDIIDDDGGCFGSNCMCYDSYGIEKCYDSCSCVLDSTLQECSSVQVPIPEGWCFHRTGVSLIIISWMLVINSIYHIVLLWLRTRN